MLFWGEIKESGGVKKCSKIGHIAKISLSSKLCGNFADFLYLFTHGQIQLLKNKSL